MMLCRFCWRDFDEWLPRRQAALKLFAAIRCTVTMSEALLDLNEAAALLGYSVSGLRKLVSRREVRFFQARPHAPIKFRRAWLDDFIDSNSIEPGAPPVIAKRKKPKREPFESRFGLDPSLLDI